MEHSFISSSRRCSRLRERRPRETKTSRPGHKVASIVSLPSVCPRVCFAFFLPLFFFVSLLTDWMNSPTMFLLFLDINRRRIAVETAAGTFPFTGFDDSICCSQPGFTFKGIAAAAAAFRQNFGNLFFPRFLSFLAVRLYSRDRVPLAFDRFLSTRSASAIFPWGRGAGGGGGGNKISPGQTTTTKMPASIFLRAVESVYRLERRATQLFYAFFIYLLDANSSRHSVPPPARNFPICSRRKERLTGKQALAPRLRRRF